MQIRLGLSQISILFFEWFQMGIRQCLPPKKYLDKEEVKWNRKRSRKKNNRADIGMKRQEGGGRRGLSEEPKIILPLFHFPLLSKVMENKMVTNCEHWGKSPFFLLYDLRYGQGGLKKWPIKVTIEADIWPWITAYQILCGEENFTIECEKFKLKRNMLQLLKVFVWAILQVKPPKYLRISMQSKNTFEFDWWRLRQTAWLEVIHDPRQKVHVCKIGSTRKVNSPKVYLCIYLVGR